MEQKGEAVERDIEGIRGKLWRNKVDGIIPGVTG